MKQLCCNRRGLSLFCSFSQIGNFAEFWAAAKEKSSVKPDFWRMKQKALQIGEKFCKIDKKRGKKNEY